MVEEKRNTLHALRAENGYEETTANDSCRSIRYLVCWFVAHRSQWYYRQWYRRWLWSTGTGITLSFISYRSIVWGSGVRACVHVVRVRRKWMTTIPVWPGVIKRPCTTQSSTPAWWWLWRWRRTGDHFRRQFSLHTQSAARVCGHMGCFHAVV